MFQECAEHVVRSIPHHRLRAKDLLTLTSLYVINTERKGSFIARSVMKLKKPLLKRTGILFLICALSLSSFLIQNVQTVSAATYHFHKDSITSKSWSSIKPKVKKWLQRAVPYASPCSYLIDWKHENAEGLDCSGFVNTMVRLYYRE